MTDPEQVPEEPALAKDELREFLLYRRLARPEADRAAAADAIADALLGRLRGIGTLAAFVPDPSEPGCGRLPAAYAELGARILLPVIPPTGRILDWAVYTGELESGRYGLSQPVGPRLGPDGDRGRRRRRRPGVGGGPLRLSAWAAGAATTTGHSSTRAPTPCSSRWCSTTNGSPSCRARSTTGR